ncbi:pro-neuregulin-1, membrane-bound isoform-like protein [Willisornis vidua]|uniref:Pro-neuregulin-1, membrane-bound isoform-like protein n=1 Tax=Willisornis vidua TaxID=1566151 RepID=A0ABQ9DQE6_9PASS|nr:pro-neuregulin-1, membrane-bound isoform-like protein [Willisornis vidua]
MAEATGSAVPTGEGMAEKKKASNGRKGRKGKGPGKKPAPPEEVEAPGSATGTPELVLKKLVTGKKDGVGLAFSAHLRSVVPPKLKEMKNQEAAVGQKLVLRCETTSEYPALRFKWLKNGKEITKKNKPENIKIPKKQKKYSELHIHRATLADAGEYVCRVSSKLGNDSTKASVIITDTNESTSKIPVSTEGTKTSSQVVILMDPPLFQATEIFNSSYDRPECLTVHLKLCGKKIRS